MASRRRRRSREPSQANDRHESRDRRRVSRGDLKAAGIAFASLGGWLVVTNGGQHWTVYFPASRPIRVVEWWPSTGKMAVDKDWDGVKRAESWQDVYRYLNKQSVGGSIKLYDEPNTGSN